MQRRGRTRSRRHLAARDHPPTKLLIYKRQTAINTQNCIRATRTFPNDMFIRSCIMHEIKDQLAPDYYVRMMDYVSFLHTRKLILEEPPAR